MKRYLNKIVIFFIFFVFTCFFASNVLAVAEHTHVDKLFEIRENIASQGEKLPEFIKKTKGNECRTLERIFELNTSALTTIEAYFRIFKIAISTNDNKEINKVSILNDWLGFIRTQCGYDIEYLDEALIETKNSDVITAIKVSKKNIESLSAVVSLGINENNT